jgi:hypothetical protein
LGELGLEEDAMRTKILVSTKVRNEHNAIFKEIESIVENRFGKENKEEDIEIISENMLKNDDKKWQKNFWENECRFFCFASDDEDNVAYNVPFAIKNLVPCVIVKGTRIRDDYKLHFRDLLCNETDIKNIDAAIIENMCYEVHKRVDKDDNIEGDIRGANVIVSMFQHSQQKN